MANAPSPEPKESTIETPAPEVLKPKADDGSEVTDSQPAPSAGAKQSPRRHQTYHPSHRATFIGLAVVVAVLAINAGIITFVLKSQTKANNKADQGAVTLSTAALDKLGVNQTAAGDLGVQLIVNPNAQFKGTVTVGGDTSIAGQLKINAKLTASDASLTQLEAGNTSLQKLDVNGDTTTGNLSLRQDLLVTGTSRLQGPTIVSQLLTVNNSVNISGSLSVGGTISVNNFHAGSLITDSSLTIGGHVVTRGSAPGVSKFSSPAFGSNGTVSISGNDAAGTIGINIGAGTSGGGCLARVTFNNAYSVIPHVVTTALGDMGDVYLRNKGSNGFDVCVGGPLSPGGYTIDYIVEQ